MDAAREVVLVNQSGRFGFRAVTALVGAGCAAVWVVAAGGCKSSSVPESVAANEPPATAGGEHLPQAAKLVYEGFSTPESVLYDADSDVYYVSNIDGSPIEADGKGFISKLTPDGKVEQLKFIDGEAAGVTLNAPKGMGIANGKLYVADIDTVRVFDAKTGAATGEVKIGGATFLNDIAIGENGKVYVSDSGVTLGDSGFEPTGTDAVYEVSLPEGAKPLIRGDELGAPNGLLPTGDGLWVVTFSSGELYRIDEAGARADVQAIEPGGLDGIVALSDGSILMTSWAGSAVLRGRPGQAFEPVFSNLEAPADIGYDKKRNRLLVPRFNHNKVEVYELP